MPAKAKKRKSIKTYSANLDKPIVACTNGSGLWSSAERNVRIKKIDFGGIVYFPEDHSLTAYLRAHFQKKDWDVEKHGLIYTDRRWEKQFASQFVKLKEFNKLVASRNVGYTEQGMQGDNYVSLALRIEGLKNVQKFFDRINLSKKELDTMKQEDGSYSWSR